ncbi:MAG TPA: ATP-NAD kinase family protein [Anaerolineae bacterium]|nr:ATP-NAD kinase family protein [Anaerolineae bacterium]
MTVSIARTSQAGLVAVQDGLAYGESKNGMEKKRLGLIVNPVAGLGGRVGLKGSDGADIQRRALELGAVAESPRRAQLALEMLSPLKDQLEVFTYPGEMGEDVVSRCGLMATVVGTITPGKTTGEDTIRAAGEMRGLGVELLLFAGGDGTARDVYEAVGLTLPVLGIPAGVKIHSAAFASSPMAAGELAASYLRGGVPSLREAEIMDIDEDAFRRDVLSARLYGYLKIPFRRALVQGAKSASGPGEEAAQRAIAMAIVELMEDDCAYILGPGSTTRAIARQLGLEKTLLGVDVVKNREMVARDVGESELLQLVRRARAKIIVTPIGGQGYILGRGNQQISPRVIRKVGTDRIIVVSTQEKIDSLAGQPLRVDTGDGELDRALNGYIRVVAGHGEQIVYRVSCFAGT